VDGDGDGKRDLFNDLDDVIASVANYFARKGQWQRGGPVMQRALRDASAADFVNPGNAVTLITLDGKAGPEDWIVFNNFKAITSYNISRLYATAVFQLAEAIAGRSPDPA
jgi:membrane-bound lytic murein transglycosylase B